MSNNLNLTQVAEDQANAEVPINDKGGEIDAALTETVEIDLTSDASVSSTDYRRAIRLLVTTAGTSKKLTLPAVKRLLAVENQGGNGITLVKGTTELALADGNSAMIYTDGTTNGLTRISSGGGGGGSGERPADLAVFMPGKPLDGATIMRFNVVREFTLPEDLVGSLFEAGVAATASSVFTINQNGSPIGTLTFAASGTVPTVSFSTAVDLEVGDVVTITAPTPQDATLADIGFNFLGSRASGGTGLEPFDLGIYLPGKPLDGATILRFNAVRSFILQSGLTGSLATADDASSATADFDITLNGSPIGSISFATDDAGTFTFADDVIVEPGDILAIVAPSPQDATLANIAINILGAR